MSKPKVKKYRQSNTIPSFISEDHLQSTHQLLLHRRRQTTWQVHTVQLTNTTSSEYIRITETQKSSLQYFRDVH